jgi:hypothetical protein
MGDADRDRAQILARRRRFVASALAGVVVAGCDQCVPKPCLEPPAIDAASAPLTPCLSKMMPADGGESAPRPCLEPMPAPTTSDAPAPKTCLSVSGPAPDGGPPKER